MNTRDRLAHDAELQTVLRTHPRLKLEILATISRLFREYQIDLAPEVLSNLTLTVRSTSQPTAALQSQAGIQAGPQGDDEPAPDGDAEPAPDGGEEPAPGGEEPAPGGDKEPAPHGQALTTDPAIADVLVQEPV